MQFIPSERDFKSFGLEHKVRSIAPMVEQLYRFFPTKLIKHQGIYFLCVNNRPVYIGESIDLESRLVSHYREKSKFWDQSHFLLLRASDFERKTTEKFLIRYFQPVFNLSCLGRLSHDERLIAKECLLANGVDVSKWDQSKRYVGWGVNP